MTDADGDISIGQLPFVNVLDVGAIAGFILLNQNTFERLSLLEM